MIWVGFAWATRLLQSEPFRASQRPHSDKIRLPAAQSHAFTTLLFAITFGLSAYNFFRAVTLDPGTCPKPSSDEELKTVCISAFFI
jgi:palmitoyltransferase ZDHHC13/17